MLQYSNPQMLAKRQPPTAMAPHPRGQIAVINIALGNYYDFWMFVRTMAYFIDYSNGQIVMNLYVTHYCLVFEDHFKVLLRSYHALYAQRPGRATSQKI